jgi:hypothetical protein
MSIRDIYPPDFQINYHADRHEARRRRAFKALEIGDVLAEVDNLIAAEPDPWKHPCAALVAWLLDRQLTPLDGGQLYESVFKKVLYERGGESSDESWSHGSWFHSSEANIRHLWIIGGSG